MNRTKTKIKEINKKSKNGLKNRFNLGETQRTDYHKIKEEHKPLIFEAFVKGWTLQEIANKLKKDFNIEISLTGVWFWKDRNKEEYEVFRKDWLADIKEIPLANQKCRIAELEKTYRKLSKKINEIIETVPFSQWDRINLAGLIRESNKMLEQLQDESGDKINRIEGKGMSPTIQIYNTLPGILKERLEETEQKQNGNRL